MKDETENGVFVSKVQKVDMDLQTFIYHMQLVVVITPNSSTYVHVCKQQQGPNFCLLSSGGRIILYVTPVNGRPHLALLVVK